jgi:multiple antibiotic resistance protein
MKTFLLCFVPLFVAVDAIGVLPIFLGLTQGSSPAQLRRIIFKSMITAALVALLFVAGGPQVLRLLGITIADFMVAGGVLLFVISIAELLKTGRTSPRIDTESLGTVPLGVPLITGPAVLTTSMLLVDLHGLAYTSAAVVANVLLAGIIFSGAQFINKLIGATGASIISKVAHLLLGAIAVMMVRKGLVSLLSLP